MGTSRHLMNTYISYIVFSNALRSGIVYFAIMQNLSSLLGIRSNPGWALIFLSQRATQILLIILPQNITEYGNSMKYRDRFDCAKCLLRQYRAVDVL